MSDGFFETNLHPVAVHNKDSFPERDASEEGICDRMRASMDNAFASNASVIECSHSGERETINFEDGRNASAKRNKLPLPRKRSSSLLAEKGDSMKEIEKKEEIMGGAFWPKVGSLEEKAKRLKALGVVPGSIAELMDVIVAGDNMQDISALCAAFPDVLYCHQIKRNFPFVMAPLVTPYHKKDITLKGHTICEVDCGRSCQTAHHLVDGKNDFIYSIQAFKLCIDDEGLTRNELIAAGQLVPASVGLHL
ncbi:MAG: hypothetical protein HGA36_03440 [Candidatus Moranbacteria bacterium]|nr:hypothetical protein [Candidatus Moranbacteria bacterium]